MCKYLGHFAAIVCPERFVSKIHQMGHFFYTGYKTRGLGYCGKNVRFTSDNDIAGAQYISIGDNSTLAKGVRLSVTDSLTEKPSLVIGRNCMIGRYSFITVAFAVTIGDNLLTGSNVLISDNSHGQSTFDDMKIEPCKRKLYSKGCVTIGNNVWIGNNASILPGVKIGDGCIIGANAVVTKSLPPYCVAVGNPATVVNRIISG